MVAISQNLARVIDEAVIRSEASTPLKIRKIAIIELAAIFGGSESKWKAIAGRTPEKRLKVLSMYLNKAGITEAEGGISAPLASEFLDHLVTSSRAEIEEMLFDTGNYVRPPGSVQFFV